MIVLANGKVITRDPDGTGDLSELALGWATYNGDHRAGPGPCQCGQ